MEILLMQRDPEYGSVHMMISLSLLLRHSITLAQMLEVSARTYLLPFLVNLMDQAL